jgi:ribosome-binding factor A
MSTKRTERVAEQIQREISDILIKDINDPRIGFVTITEVRISDDLQNARVFASILGDEKKQEESMQGLRSATPYIQREVGRRIRLRVTPQLHFTLDSSVERGARTEQLLREVRERDEELKKKFPAPQSQAE